MSWHVQRTSREVKHKVDAHTRHKRGQRASIFTIYILMHLSIYPSICSIYQSIHPSFHPSMHPSTSIYLSYLDMHLLFAYPYYLCIYLGTIEHIISSIIYIYIYISICIYKESLFEAHQHGKSVFFFSIGRRPCKSSAPPSCVLTISSKVLRCRRKENMDLSEK